MTEINRKSVKLIVMDVDGTLTDGRIYFDKNGEAMKAFNVKDGFGIKQLLPRAGIIPAIITGRASQIVEKRCQELNIIHLFQGAENKLEVLDELLESLSLQRDETAFIGDDINDYAAMKECGFKACPSDAVKDIQEICDYISPYNAGYGAVRDIIEWMLKAPAKS